MGRLKIRRAIASLTILFFWAFQGAPWTLKNRAIRGPSFLLGGLAGQAPRNSVTAVGHLKNEQDLLTYMRALWKQRNDRGRATERPYDRPQLSVVARTNATFEVTSVRRIYNTIASNVQELSCDYRHADGLSLYPTNNK
jgi:hypothetical protein